MIPGMPSAIPVEAWMENFGAAKKDMCKGFPDLCGLSKAFLFSKQHPVLQQHLVLQENPMLSVIIRHFVAFSKFNIVRPCVCTIPANPHWPWSHQPKGDAMPRACWQITQTFFRTGSWIQLQTARSY